MFISASVVALMLLVGLLFLSLSYGTVRISFEQIFTFFSPNADSSANMMLDVIIRDVRLPRFLLAVLVGAGLAMVGVLLQTVTKNDLADPFLFGLSAGASVGAVAVMTHFNTSLGQWTLPIATFVGGLISAISVIVLFTTFKSC